jgi:excisionase family DNA binding protein
MSIQSTGLAHDEKRRLGGTAIRQIDPITVTIAEARRLSGLSNTTVYKLIGEKKLEIVKVGTRTLVVYQSLKALLEPAAA